RKSRRGCNCLRQSDVRVAETADHVVPSIWFREAPEHACLQVRCAKDKSWLVREVLKRACAKQISFVFRRDLGGRRCPWKQSGQCINRINFLSREGENGMHIGGFESPGVEPPVRVHRSQLVPYRREIAGCYGPPGDTRNALGPREDSELVEPH